MWAALAHDWGKPAMRSEETNGRVRFFDHDNFGALLVENRARALKMSADETAYLTRLVQMHMRPGDLAHDYPPGPRAIYRYFRDAQRTGPDVVLLSLADQMAVRAPIRGGAVAAAAGDVTPPARQLLSPARRTREPRVAA